MNDSGKLTEWDRAKGYGWIAAGGRRVFAHIKEFERGQRRPVAGDEVTFSSGTDARGRACAKGIRLTKQEARIGIGGWALLAGLLVLPLFAGILLPYPLWVPPCWIAVASVVAWFYYARDKRSAREGRWRVSEANLHLVEFLGGWPGAFLAQRKFRHKTRKVSFQAVFWGIVLIYQLAAVDVILDGTLREWVGEMWRVISER